MTDLAIRGLEARYGAVRVLHAIDLDVGAGKVVAVLGANGAGKSTLLRSITGMADATGSIRFGDIELVGRRTEQIARCGIAHVPEGRGTIVELSVEENLVVGSFARATKAGVADDLAAIYDLFPVLGHRRGQPAGQLSGGEQQMLAIGRAIMSRPALLVLDEPSLGLAPIIVQQLFGVLGEINRTSATSMLIVEQNADRALDLASDVYVLETGEVVAHAGPEAIRNDDVLRRAYLGG